MEKQKISLCMIVQDEEECIARAMENIYRYVDEIIIFDSGSTDNTAIIINEYSKIEDFPPLGIYYHPLEGDFSAQRNRCIEKATGDWILIMDADETFDQDLLNNLQRLCQNEFHDLYAFERRTRINGHLANLCNFDFHSRLFRNNGKIRYDGKMHESLTGYDQLQLVNASINHDKKAEWQQKDNERVWDLGQQPPPGWRKVDGKWQYFRESNEKPHYHYPDKSAWKEDDPRVSMYNFDEESFRQWYNDFAKQLPALTVEQIGLSPKEQMIADAIAQEYKGSRALDIGCGNGKVLVSLLKQGLLAEGCGIDISDEAVKFSQLTAQNCGIPLQGGCFATFKRSSVEGFPIDRKYDVVIAFDILEHIFSLRDALHHIKSFLRAGGMLCGSVPFMHICDAPTHLHYFSEESLGNLLREYFSDVKVTKIDLTGMLEYHLVFTGKKI